MDKKFYAISEDKLKELLEASIRLEILETDGVEDWQWYMESYRPIMETYVYDEKLKGRIFTQEEEDDYEIYDAVENLLNEYPSISSYNGNKIE